MRQLVEGMAVGFDSAAAGPLRAVVELAFTGEEPGTYQLVISDRACRFEGAPVAEPDLRVEADAELWRAISEGRAQPMAAVLEGRLKVSGDLALFQRFPSLFRRVGREDLRAPPGQRAPGPLRLPAMAWLFVDLLPWKVFWVFLALQGSQRAVIAAAAVAVVVLVARGMTGGATFLEKATTVVFVASALAVSQGYRPPPGLLGSSFLALGAIWAASVIHATYPLTAEYSRWNYVPRLWSTGLFRHPNALLTLLWSVVFVAFAVLGVAGARGWIPQRVSTVASILICVAAGAYTRRREAGARDRRIDDLDASLARMRTAARALLGLVAVGFVLMGDPLAQPGWLLLPATAVAAAALWPRGVDARGRHVEASEDRRRAVPVR
jgi:hypothetical protein